MMTTIEPPSDGATRWLTSLGYTSRGGTTEIMKNIVVERLLGLPRDLR